MYLAAVSLFMFILPLASIAIEAVAGNNHSSIIVLAGKWFVFWAIGVRLFTAGVRQVIKPGLTAGGIFGIKGREAWVLVRELGFANVSIGLAGIISLWQPQWRLAAAFAGGLFLLLDGAQHLTSKRNFDENVAMYSDIFVGVVMALFIIASW